MNRRLAPIAALVLVATTAQAISAQTPQPAAGTTLPVGTRVQLTLVTPVRSKSSKPGDTIRATVAFPVTIGSKQAIPSGAFVEGTLQSVSRRVRAPQTAFVVRFTRIILPDGYSEPLAGEQASVVGRRNAPVLLAWNEAPAGTADFLLAQVPPGYPPLPTQPTLPSQSHTGAIVGVSIGIAAFAALGVYGIVHGSHQDRLLYDAGWQFEMKLTAPLTLPPPLPVAGS